MRIASPPISKRRRNKMFTARYVGQLLATNDIRLVLEFPDRATDLGLIARGSGIDTRHLGSRTASIRVCTRYLFRYILRH